MLLIQREGDLVHTTHYSHILLPGATRVDNVYVPTEAKHYLPELFLLGPFKCAASSQASGTMFAPHFGRGRAISNVMTEVQLTIVQSFVPFQSQQYIPIAASLMRFPFELSPPSLPCVLSPRRTDT